MNCVDGNSLIHHPIKSAFKTLMAIRFPRITLLQQQPSSLGHVNTTTSRAHMVAFSSSLKGHKLISRPFASLLLDRSRRCWGSSATSITATGVVDQQDGRLQALISAGFKSVDAKYLLNTLERLSEAKAKEIRESYLTKDEYNSILKAYNSGIDRFFIENQSVQKNSDESVQEGYSNLIQRSSALNSSIIEEIKSYESGIQLDINLEKKKQQEFVSKLNAQASNIDKYMTTSVENVRQKLTGLEQSGKYAVFGK